MNSERRKRIADLVERLEGIQAEVEEIHAEEEGAHENLPESLQSSEQAQVMEAAAEHLITVYDDLSETIDTLRMAIGDDA